MQEWNIVSACCHRSIVEGHLKDFPLGGATWFINYKASFCECCGQESPEEAKECAVCGVVDCKDNCEW